MNKYVIFDLDGTLFDSMDFWNGVGREFLSRYGVTEFPADFNEKVKSMSVKQSSLYFMRTFNIDVTEQFISDSMREIVAERYRKYADFKPNVRETLETLYANGVTMCIATATYRELIEEALQRLKASHFFKFVLSCNDIGSGKDSPEIFYEAVSRMGGDVKSTVVVEDALHAITTAKNAGFKVVAVHDKYQDDNVDMIRKTADKYLIHMDADTILNI